jgi:ABC-2 type transport system ATP-binding protein
MIEVRSLRKTYPGGVEAVRGLDFDVGPGEVFGLLGPNGAGKSTTIGMLTTTIRPTGGTARLDGLDVSRDPLAARRASSVVFQEAAVDRSLTGRRHLDLHAQLWGVEQRQATQRIDDVTAALGLGTLIDRMVGSYSGGERRRLELARALVSRPRVLFLDEPTVGLDPLIRHELLDLVAGLKSREELTTLVTTHYLDEAERLCDRLAIMHDGLIVALGTPAELKDQLGRELLELRIDGDAPAALAVLRDRGIADGDAFLVGSTVTVPLNGHASSEVIAAVGELRLATSVSSRPPTLDDVYLRLTGGGLAEAA